QPAANPQVEMIECGRLDGEPHLPGAGLGHRHVVPNLHDLGSAEAREDGCLHRPGHRFRPVVYWGGGRTGDLTVATATPRRRSSRTSTVRDPLDFFNSLLV